MMKILIVAFACMPERGREEGIGWNLTLQLAKLGHEVWVLTLCDSAVKCQNHPEAKIQANLHFIPVAFKWMKSLQDGKSSKYLHQLRYFHWKKLVREVALQLDKEHKFDLIHHLTIASLQGGPSLWNFKQPLVFGPVGGGQTAPPAFKKYFFTYWREEVLRSLILCKFSSINFCLRRALSNTDLLLATNQDTLVLSQRLGARNVELCLDSSLPLDYFPPAVPKRSHSQELRVLWLGKIIPRKGLFLAFEALSEVDSSIPFKLTVIGSGIFDDYLFSWIDSFKLKEKVEYLGKVPWTEVKKAYLSNDVFLFTSLRDSYGSVLLEAMSQGLPIITLNHHGARDFVPKNAGIKVAVTNPNETVNALARGIEYMYENPQKRIEMGKAGYNYSKQQSWKQRAIKISQFYKQVLSQHY